MTVRMDVEEIQTVVVKSAQAFKKAKAVDEIPF